MKRSRRRYLAHAALCAFALATLASGCLQTLSVPLSMRVMSVPEPEPGEPDVRRTYWEGGADSGRLRTETAGLTQRGGAFVKHGSERTFFRSGAREAERQWNLGVASGTWRAWWEDGTPRSECEFPDDGHPTTMSFWHANGALEARGTAVNGRRIGPWEYFFPDGSKESTGDFLDGKREGEWTEWNECGDIVARCHYSNGVKVRIR